MPTSIDTTAVQARLRAALDAPLARSDPARASLADIPVLLAAIAGRDNLIRNLSADLVECADRLVHTSQHLALAWGLDGTAADAAAVRLLVSIATEKRAS